MAFHVGQKVVCVKTTVATKWHPRHAEMTRLTVGDVYTIRAIDTRSLNLGLHDSATILLHEVHNAVFPTNVGLWETGYHPARFRPLIERKQSTSTGFEILDDIRKRETFPQHGDAPITRRERVPNSEG